jgi:16S rRNA (adenine1518-N6/adenine1519-N6)-dimethyltransferase
VDVKSLLSKLDLSAKKRFGQNFLANEADLHFIADALGAAPGQTVLEIGPGLGALTAALLERGLRVVAVEKDRSLAVHLERQFKGRPLEVIGTDILHFDPAAAPLKEHAPLSVVGNIPYNITSPILFWLVEHRAVVQRAVLTVQKEVAERLAGKPGHEHWGAVSVSLGAYADVTLLKLIPAGHFYPAPKVDSAVVRLDILPQPRYDLRDGGVFHRIVARAFQKRRKTLLNALVDERAGWDKKFLLEAFSGLGLDPRRRPETLAVSEWVLLARQLGK